MKEVTKAERRQHHWLAAGEVTFNFTDNGETGLNAARLNCLVLSQDKQLRVQEIARAQQGLQMVLSQRVGAEVFTKNVQVTNVTMLGLIYLGHMTETEFNAKPEGTKLQQVATEQVLHS